MGSVDYGDLDDTPEKVGATTRMMAATLSHVARLVREQPYPPESSGVPLESSG